MRTVPKRLTPRRPSGAAPRSRALWPAGGAAGGTEAERRGPYRVRAPTPVPGTRKTGERNDHAKSAEAAATANKKKENVGETRMVLCKLTDLELSGAPQLQPGEAGSCRPTRPLERLVRPQEHSAQEANTTSPERRHGSADHTPPRATNLEEASTSKRCRSH